MIMKIQGIVEIAPEPLGEQSAKLLYSAYRASRSAVVMLVLDRPTLMMADRFLDQIVVREGIDVKGVVYVDVEDERTVAAAARDASFVVASTAAFRSRLAAYGIACEDAISWSERAVAAAP
jgi:hypothetical protein